MTAQPFTHGRTGEAANNPSPDAWTFRAPRFGDLVVCPYCDADTFICDHCGGSREMFADEFFGETQ